MTAGKIKEIQKSHHHRSKQNTFGRNAEKERKHKAGRRNTKRTRVVHRGRQRVVRSRARGVSLGWSVTR